MSTAPHKSPGLQATVTGSGQEYESTDLKLEIGQWYWVKQYETVYSEDEDGEDEVREVKPWLGCIARIGSNYVKLVGIRNYQSQSYKRVLFEEFDEWCTPEANPDKLIASKVEMYRANIGELMNDVKRLTSGLGIAPKGTIAEHSEESTTALAVAHGTENIQDHKNALIRAKEETLPALFKKIENESRGMAAWMKAQLIPMEAEADNLKVSTEVIDQRIFTVELYAGLIEKTIQIKKGKPAPNDTKIHLFQRRHYMDEECLAEYEAGGMDYKSIRDFDKWLTKKANLNRILPHSRCIVAFQVRRNTKDREGFTLNDFIAIAQEIEADEKTFLYIRNGKQVFRLSTGIDFGEQLFPDQNQSTLLGDNSLWMEISHGCKRVVSQREYDHIQEKRAERMAEWEEDMRKWEAKQAKKKKKEDRFWAPNKPYNMDHWQKCTPESVYYDDAMKMVAMAAMEHNRVAVVLQGLLDRSPALHPHPPWQIWKPDGFANAIELVYDSTRVLTDGDRPDFEAYRTKLNASIKKGSRTVGQQDFWERIEAEKEYQRQCDDYRVKRAHHWVRYTPYGNPGPGIIAKVIRLGRSGLCHYEWERERLRPKWVSDPENPGYDKLDETGITTRFSCGKSKILNVDAYTPGDFKIFYSDPRTRADYLKWAPLLLAAEDWHASKS